MKNEKNIFGLLLISLLLIWVIFIFFQYVTNHSNYVLFFIIFDTVAGDIIFLLFIAFLAFCLGSAIIKFAFKIQLNSDCSFLFSSALGFIILSLGMEILTFSQILSKLSVISFLIILILVSSKEIISTIKKIKLPLFKLISNYDYIFLFFLLIFILINFIFALTPPVGHDEQQYHLTAPLRYIQNGGFYVIKNIGSQVNYPQNTEMLYTLALILKGDISAKLINFYFGLLILLLIHSISKRFFKFSGILPSAIFYCSWLTYYISTRADVELAQTFFVSISLYSILIWLENYVGASPTPTISPNSECNKERIYSLPTFYFYFSAITAGFSLGIKYNSLFSILALFLVLIYYYLFILKEKLKLLILSLSKYLIIILLLFSPWVIKNIIYFKNPFEPFKVNKILSIATGLFTKNIQQEPKDSYLTERAHILYRISYPEYSLKELLLVPYNATIYGEWGRQVFDSLITPFYLMFLPFIIFIRKKNRVVIALLIYILINYLLWLFIQPLTRYLTPFMPFMAILSTYVIYQLTVVGNEYMRSLLKYFGHIFKILVITSIFIMMCTHILDFIKKNPVYYLFGLESKYKFLERNNAVGIQPFIEYINYNLPESTKVYLLWEKRGYYLERDYKEDTYGNIFARLIAQHNEPSKVAEELKKMGFTHILCDTNIPRFWFGSSYKNKINQQVREIGNREFEFFEKMAQENLTLLMKNSVLRLYEIN